ncbi:MAG: ABC transporter permease [Thermomicrobiales bacterium]
MSEFSYLTSHWDQVVHLTWEHLRLSVLAIVIAFPIAVVIGTVAAVVRPLTFPILAILGFVYTIPSLALLAFLIPSQGLGTRPALIMLVLYAQVFLVRNIVAGLRGVDAATLEAATGLGMSAWQRYVRVWVPLASPVIVAGMRTALVAVIGLTTIAGWINAGGLGELLFVGIGRNYPAMVFAGVIAIVALAIAADLVMRVVETLSPVARSQRARRAG